ncbi:MAG: MraY family glycosyltransferase, partial [Dehalococcoidia bacterium]|nr:MraY family glycosyltransferase [Dehalococcoidia bacterium]
IVLPFQLGEFPFSITLLADIFAFIWLMLMINTMNFLDGLDGLAAGVGAIGAFIIFILSLLPIVNQPATATVALILAGCLLGFLCFNFNPASIFMGDGGSTFIGLSLATLAIIANGKIATTLLVLGLPLIDVALVVLRRIFIDRRAPWQGDRKHFHHRLLSIGLSQRQSVIVVYIFCSIFGSAALFLGSSQKLLALGIMALAMLSLFAVVIFLERRQQMRPPTLPH